MKIIIDCGFYKFFPDNPMDTSIAMSRGMDLINAGECLTFAGLLNAPTYSLIGRDNAIAQYSGTPAQVFNANRWVWHLTQNKIVPADLISLSSGLRLGGGRINCIGIPQAGAMVGNAGRLKSAVIYWRPETNTCNVQGIELWT